MLQAGELDARLGNGDGVELKIQQGNSGKASSKAHLWSQCILSGVKHVVYGHAAPLPPPAARTTDAQAPVATQHTDQGATVTAGGAGAGAGSTGAGDGTTSGGAAHRDSKGAAHATVPLRALVVGERDQEKDARRGKDYLLTRVEQTSTEDHFASLDLATIKDCVSFVEHLIKGLLHHMEEGTVYRLEKLFQKLVLIKCPDGEPVMDPAVVERALAGGAYTLPEND